MTTSRTDRPPNDSIGWVADGNPQLGAALAAAAGSDPLLKVLAEAHRYWAGRDDGPDIIGFAHAKRGRGRK